MLTQLKNPRLYFMALIESAIFAMAYTGAHLLRFEFHVTPLDFRQIMLVLPWLIPSKLVVFYALGLYKGMWRYTSLRDFWLLAQGCFFSSLVVVAIVLFLYHFAGFSRAVFLLDGLLTFVMTGGARMAIRTYYSAKTGSRGGQVMGLPALRSMPRDRKRVVIIGGGGSGEKMLREIFDNPHLSYEVVCFLDDNPGKKGRAFRVLWKTGRSTRYSSPHPRRQAPRCAVYSIHAKAARSHSRRSPPSVRFSMER
jgi:FlaA1/EpsC-like NDP-sugar epimerase